MQSIFETVLVNLAREMARGTIEGLMQRYTVADLREHVSKDTDVITEAFRSPDARDRQALEWMVDKARRYAKYGPQIRAQVTPEWMLGWLHKRYPQHSAVLETAAGRQWFSKNFRALLTYFFPQ